MASLKKKSPAKAKKIVKKIAAKNPVAKKAATKKSAARKPVAKKAVSKAPARQSLQGLTEQMLAAALKVLDERQASEIATIPLMGQSSIADYMIIASGRTGRQVAALADHLREAFAKLGAHSVRVEGQESCNWVLVDAGDIIIHLFLPDVRRYYDLDKLWAGSRE